MTVNVLITRPEAAGLELADQLRNRWGCAARIILSPGLEIHWLDRPLDLTGVKTLIFTSKNGVAAFLHQSERRDLPCYAVGPGTAESANAAGLETHQAGGDAEALIDQLRRDRPDGPCLHVRGEHAVTPMANRLSDAGIPTREVVLYDQRERPLGPDALACLNGTTPVILPLYSPRSAKILFAQMQPSAPLFVACISPAVRRIVPTGENITVMAADQPNAEAMMKVLEILYEQAKRLEGTNRAQ